MNMAAILSPSIGHAAAPPPATSPRVAWATCAVVFAVLAALPWLMTHFGLEYYLGFVRKMLITVLAVSALDLLVGQAGLVAMGQAGFMGVGAYAMAAGVDAGLTSGTALLPLALAAAALFAAGVGAVALRVRGVYFIMITLAFAQMMYYLAVTLKNFGGDDGFNLSKRPLLPGGLSLDDDPTFYWVVLGLVALSLWAIQRVMASPFGHVLRASRDNEARTSALGHSVFKARLLAFVFAGALSGLAGALMLVHNGFVSPASMHWSASAVLLTMLVIGGIGRRWGPVLGVAFWQLLEEGLRQWTEYWHWPLGAMLIGVALWAPAGLAALRAGAFMRGR
jgi:branched-chain amino acid transport system permease protein